MRRGGGIAVYRGIEEVPPDAGPSVLTIGVFDGVHRGHQALMRRVVEKARELDATPAVVTFDRHPLEVIAPGKEPPLLTTVPQRARVMETLGIEAVVVLRFDDALRHKEPEQFVREVLVDLLRARHVVVGVNFRFGHQQAGTIETLSDLGKRFGFESTIVAMQVGPDHEIVSSSLIRSHVAEGLVERVAEELDRPVLLEGCVEHGAGRGKGLGFPTANLRIPERMVLPKIGVYAGWMWWRGSRFPVVMNVGVNPTFGDRSSPVVEVHVLDFEEELYGEIIEVEFLHRLRDELKFPDVASLVAQIHNDATQARELLKTV